MPGFPAIPMDEPPLENAEMAYGTALVHRRKLVAAMMKSGDVSDAAAKRLILADQLAMTLKRIVNDEKDEGEG
jgi:hypothetical protein